MSRSPWFVAVALAALQASDAGACSVSAEAAAHVFRSTKGGPAGHRPWIALWNVGDKDAVELTVVPATCAKDTVCKGTAVPFDRAGRYVRPKADLAHNARLQVVVAGKLLDDVTVAPSPGAGLPAWNGIDVGSAGTEAEGLCSPAGPAVHLKVKPTTAVLDDAVILVYFTKPDPKTPHAGLAQIVSLGAGPEITLRNGLGETVWMKGVPRAMWVVLADGDGHLGPPIRAI